MAGKKGFKRPHPQEARDGVPSAKKARMAARVDSLAWKEVAMPDRMDDYEGFFGLEEIDDVDVVRDASGKLSFMTTQTNQRTAVPLDQSNDDASDDGEEWTGFGSDIDEVAAPDNSVSETKPAQKKPTKTKASDKKSAKPNPKDIKNDKPAANAAAAAGFRLLADNDRDREGVSVKEWLPLKLSPDTMASLSNLGFKSPTSIQKAAIPEILAGHDVIGKASTGSGKTLAFGIPILERFLEREALIKNAKPESSKAPLAMVLSPTRELAHQLSKHLTALCSNNGFRGPSIATLTGGLSVQKQERVLKDADIVVGTPGRIWEIISSGRGTIDLLKQVQFLVVDEADRLLSEGHFKEMEDILDALEWQHENDDTPVKTTTDTSARQTLVFSATFDRGLQKKLVGKAKPSGGDLLTNKESLEYLLSKLKFREEKPKFIDVNPVSQLATGLTEGLVECAGTEKDLYLYTLLLLHPRSRTLVFTNSISAVRRITPFLQNLNLPALGLHSGMPQKARLRSVERFTQSKASQSSILVATDVAARGLDIANVQLVIHYHLPRAADTYVHRSGRTARAGQKGSSILICGPEEVAGVRRLVAKVHAQSALSSEQSSADAAKAGYYIRTLDVDRRIVSRLKPRATLAKKLADTTSAKEKRNKEDDFMRAAAEELGVDYDSEDLDQQGGGRRGRGGGRKIKEREARERSKTDVAAMRAELRDLLKQRVNVGVSEKYIATGSVDMDELLRQQEAINGTASEFLGPVDGLQLM